MPTCAHCKKPIAGHPAIVHDPALGAAGDTHYHREHLKHRPKNPLPKPVRGRRMSRAEEADAFGETELTDEATTPAQRAAYETERAGKRAREWYILHVLEDGTTELSGEGPWDTKDGAIEFGEVFGFLDVAGAWSEVGVPWVVLGVPKSAAKAFDAERDRVYRDGKDTRRDWYTLKLRGREATLSGESYASQANARANADKRASKAGKRAGAPLFLAPAGFKRR